MFIGFLMLGGTEETDHACCLKAIRLAAQGALIGFGLFRPLSGRVAKQNNWAEKFVNLLLWPETELPDRVPGFGVRLAFPCWH